MYGSSSNPEMFLSQPWTQMDSQDWNFNIGGSQELPHSQNNPLTPSRRILPPTPSLSGSNNLSNSWSRRMSSQPTPQFSSQNNSPSKGLQREPLFSKEIRFSLHAVLTVVKDLPEKLKEVIGHVTNNRRHSDDDFLDKIMQIIESKLPHVEKALDFINTHESNAVDQNVFHDKLQSNMDEFKKAVDNQETTMTNFCTKQDKTGLTLRRQVALMKKSYATEAKKIQRLLQQVLACKQAEKELLIKTEQSLMMEIQNLSDSFQNFSEKALALLEDKRESELPFQKVAQDINDIRISMQNISSVIGPSTKAVISPGWMENFNSGNVRVTKPKSPFSDDHRLICSPVARVLPQPKVEGDCRKDFMNFPPEKFQKNIKKKSSFLDLIDLDCWSDESSSDQNSPPANAKDVKKIYLSKPAQPLSETPVRVQPCPNWISKPIMPKVNDQLTTPLRMQRPVHNIRTPQSNNRKKYTMLHSTPNMRNVPVKRCKLTPGTDFSSFSRQYTRPRSKIL